MARARAISTRFWSPYGRFLGRSWSAWSSSDPGVCSAESTWGSRASGDLVTTAAQGRAHEPNGGAREVGAPHHERAWAKLTTSGIDKVMARPIAINA